MLLGGNTHRSMASRVGCSAVMCDSGGHSEYGAYFNLPGEVQTAPRGELYGTIFLNERADDMATINYITDNQKVADVYNGGPQAGSKNSNCDLLNKLCVMCVSKNIIVNVRWMPSQLKLTDPRPEGVSDCDKLSHGHADQKAGPASLGFG